VAKGADCKSAASWLRRFESFLPHHVDKADFFPFLALLPAIRKAACRLQGIARVTTSSVSLALPVGGPMGWRPVARPGMFTPLQMRKRGVDGSWLYRDPTEEEVQEYLRDEAW
jgi:hypothetical protein